MGDDGVTERKPRRPDAKKKPLDGGIKKKTQRKPTKGKNDRYTTGNVLGMAHKEDKRRIGSAISDDDGD